MRLLVAFVLALASAAPAVGASAEDAAIGATSESKAEGPALTPEPAPVEPSLQLELDESGVGVVPPPPRTPDGYTLGQAEGRVRRAKIGLGVSAGLFAVGVGLMVGGSVCSNRRAIPDDELRLVPPPGCTGLLVTGGIVNTAGLVGMIVAGVRLAKRKRDRESLKRAHPELRSSYQQVSDVDTSDDAFFVIVTRKYEAGRLVGATVFIRHKDSGQYANPSIDAAEIESLDQVIREHKAKLLADIVAPEAQP